MSRIGDGQEFIDWLTAKIQGPDPAVSETNGHAGTGSSPSPISDDAIIEKCRGAGNAAKFCALFDAGDAYAHHGGDDSVADLALLSMLAFYTQDAAQLERIFTSSALGQREKWRHRADYREMTIHKALAEVGEVYMWPRERRRNSAALAAPPYIEKAAGATSGDSSEPSLIRFTNRPAPSPREFIVPDLIPRYHATTLYGWGGTAKSLIALLLCKSVAGGREKFFDRAIAVHAPVMYIDFELDADDQHRRVMQLAAGMKMEVPEDLLYVSTLGVRTHEAVEFALRACEENEVVLVVLDSLGPAMVGDMAAARDVIEFHNSYIAPFKAIGVTPVLIDHQARQQAGEGYQSKGAFGSSYKEHLSRSLIQVEAGERSADRGTLNVRLRHKKTNFGALVDPFDVSLSFSDEMIVAQVRELTPSDRAQEGTLNSRDRVLAAFEDGPAYPDELVETTGLTRSTVKNAITALKKAGRVEPTGEFRGQMEQVRLVAPAARPYKEMAAKAPRSESASVSVLRLVPSSPSHEEDTGPATVADLFANPPGWLAGQLEKYRENPEMHLKPLCTAVAAVVLGDGGRADEVHEEVVREVSRDE